MNTLFTINVSKRYLTHNTGLLGSGHSYRHYFRIETDLIKDELKGLTSELSLIYPDPDYKITVYRNTITSKEVEI
jgi:hypothetical protein